MIRFVLSLGVLGALVGSPGAVDGQAPTRIPDPPTCTECGIQADTVLRIGGLADTIGVEFVESLPVDSRGLAYFHSPYGGPIRVLAADRGAITSIGREGSGPGELAGHATLFVGPSDSLFVIDPGNARLTVFDPAHAFSRSHPIRFGPTGMFFQPGDSLTVVGDVREAPGRFHVTDRNLQVGRSFAPESESEPTGGWVAAELPEAGRVVTVRDYDYRIEVWSLDGTLLSAAVRDSEWFDARPGRVVSPTTPSDPALPSRVVAVGSLGGSHIWTATLVPDIEWERKLQHALARDERPSRTARFDTVLEVLDLGSGGVVARTRLDGIATGSPSRASVLLYEESGPIPMLAILRIQLIPERDVPGPTSSR